MPPDPVIALRDVTKRFGDLTAIDRLDLDVPHGSCIGLLGPNGAGKSTLLRLLTGQAVADTGRITVLGHELPAASRAARARCGVVPQHDDLDEELTVAENLAVYARFQHVPPARRADAIAEGLARARLTDRADTPTDELSGGMRRRLLIARGTLHRPDLVLLDEPTVGLDPQIRFELWTQVEELKNRGATVLLSTHYMEEAQQLSDRVAILHHGRLVAFDRPADLIADHVGTQVVDVTGPPAWLTAVERRASAAGVAVRRAGANVTVLDEEALPRLGLDGGTRRAANLEDVFVTLTGARLA